MKEATWPMMMKGCSTGWLPIHVRMSRFATRNQNNNCESGRNVIERCLDLCRSGIRNRIRTEAAKASTPPNLLGMERRMAYANRKYHSGLIWGGVARGFAGVKFSGSPRRLGEKNARDSRGMNISVKPRISFKEKYGWKGILSQ